MGIDSGEVRPAYRETPAPKRWPRGSTWRAGGLRTLDTDGDLRGTRAGERRHAPLVGQKESRVPGGACPAVSSRPRAHPAPALAGDRSIGVRSAKRGGSRREHTRPAASAPLRAPDADELPGPSRAGPKRRAASHPGLDAVSYTHLTLPTNRE